MLAYGGDGFDERFMKAYFRRHGLKGMEGVRFFDISTMVHRMGREWGPSKDRLCRALEIHGVTDIHTSPNDCLLERGLFEAMGGGQLLEWDGTVYGLEPMGRLPERSNPQMMPA